ncbi:alpha/beta hydrolase [Synechococcus elongatus]|uniref:Alpha/beta hydrolase n=1 Tax=Synechococcus elongatus (strain ATCC 33912 / PCC 7942 / FACHB-805) TaxID=1140 RepID=Q31SA9_SYNE7|nr:alpha/beta hydrolase [Synechococcus elongatus]ABB56060.1 conserved hypothetical protein [Synechococcus elongatus PCC 7942 = FACHB-805]AJD56875.1 hypothetical protein M744_02955 [Synechococcus elongatus UTEX 2973]MBD2587893.1 alpha/beta hydrolase [Synechococcus elongatus FACHB-242]MBD2688961.1 alpha/beta hydrolase [Synechococcus elongatus FACHB-1061]MBD2707399.1 alpha/beta hydrolase [Synechococcus elongatus PCC 7942 = FACHB-805]
MSRWSVLAFHGWGWSAASWQPWQDWFRAQGADFWAGDRGYWGSPQLDWPALGDRLWLLTHSWGLHWLPADLVARADCLICWGGFTAYHPELEPAKTQSQQALGQLRDAIASDPLAGLQGFYRQCYRPQTAPELPAIAPDRDRLLADLEQLDRSQLAIEPLLRIPQRLVLHGESDRIVPIERAQTLIDQLQPTAWKFWPRQGHALPVTAIADCQAWLQEVLAA